MYNINRRKFLEIIGCSCCGVILPSCSTVPITERKQLSIMSEGRINAQSAAVYEKFKTKTKLITKGTQLEEIKNIGKKIENSVSTFFEKRSEDDPTKYFDWEYVLVDNDKVKNAWCMPGGKIAVYTGILKITKKCEMPGVCLEEKLQCIREFLMLQKIMMGSQLLWVMKLLMQ